MKKIILPLIMAIICGSFISCSKKIDVFNDFAFGQDYDDVISVLDEYGIKYSELRSFYDISYGNDNFNEVMLSGRGYDVTLMEGIYFSSSVFNTKCEVTLYFFDGKYTKVVFEKHDNCETAYKNFSSGYNTLFADYGYELNEEKSKDDFYYYKTNTNKTIHIFNGRDYFTSYCYDNDCYKVYDDFKTAFYEEIESL